jgi:hypothetical protein
MRILIAFLLMTGLANAADVTIAWNASPEATGYKIQMSTDNGATWDSGVDVGSVLTHTLLGVADSGLVLFRAVAYNNVDDAINSWSGAWYNRDWKPPTSASGLGVQ